MTHIAHIVGARPNFMKVAPVHRALVRRARQTIVHTGQHYDASMSEIFFAQLDIPPPDINLDVGSGTHAEQTGTTMIRLERELGSLRPDLVLVYGDVNSTAAAALVCAKLGIPVGHVEAGLRSRDRSMPEEINRMVTDVLADRLFTPSADADRNLAAEGIPEERVFLVGNVMIDTLVRLLPSTAPERTKARLGVTRPFALVTLHRPSNVDDPATLGKILDALARLTPHLQIVLPVHPRTRARLARIGQGVDGLTLTEPLGYVEFLGLERAATIVMTDSGGVQEETTFLNVPCLTLRENTERPVTVDVGTNVLVGNDMAQLELEVHRILAGQAKTGAIPPLWDGKASERIADLLTD